MGALIIIGCIVGYLWIAAALGAPLAAVFYGHLTHADTYEGCMECSDSPSFGVFIRLMWPHTLVMLFTVGPIAWLVNRVRGV